MENNIKEYQEDEIELKELFLTLIKNWKIILLVTSIVTLIAMLFVYLKTPIYEVKSNLQIGYINDANNEKTLLDDPDTIVEICRVVFGVDGEMEKNKDVVSYVSDISLSKKLKNFITIKTDAISNDDALKKNKEVVKYIQNKYKSLLNNYIFENNNKIELIKKQIYNIKNYKIKEIQRKIDLLKDQKIFQIDEQINKIRSQDILNAKKEIDLLKYQKLVAINHKITFLLNVKLKNLRKKIKFHNQKLEEFSKDISNVLNTRNDIKDKTLLSITSIQIISYQNLILSSKNKIEDLKLAVALINEETIPNLKRTEKEINEIEIKKLEQKITNLNLNIVNLQKQKQNIVNDDIRRLKYKLDIEIPNKIKHLNKEIERLKFKNTQQNIQNSKVVGDYIIKNHPVKPKKALIIIISFITGFILSIFLVFFLEFIRGFKEEDGHL